MTSHQFLETGQVSPVQHHLQHNTTRSSTLRRSPHSHSGSGAGLWLANSPSPQTTAFPDATIPSTQPSADKVYKFPATLAQGGRPLGKSTAANADLHHQLWPTPADDQDVDLDLSFDFVSRFDKSPSTSLKSLSTSLKAGSSSQSRQTTPTSPSKLYKGMKADATWENRRKKAPPAPLSLSASSMVLSSSRARSTGSSDNTLPPSRVRRSPSDDIDAALSTTPLGATRRGRAINDLHQRSYNDLVSAEQKTVLAQQSSSSSSTLRRSPTSIHPTPTSLATASITRRPRSSSVRSLRSSNGATLSKRASLLGPPPFPPPTTPLPSPALSPSFQNRARLSVSLTKPVGANLESPTQTQEESAQARRGSELLQRYEQLSAAYDVVHTGNALGLGPQDPSAGATDAAPVATAVAMQYSATANSTGSSAMTWTQSDQSTPSTVLHSPLTPFTPYFSAESVRDATASSAAMPSKSHCPLPTIASAASSLQSDATPTKRQVTQQTGTRASLEVKTEERGDMTTEQWILTQRQRKALIQQHEVLVNGDAEKHGGVTRLSVLATLATADEHRPQQVQKRIVSSSSSADEEGTEQVRETMVISTASTPEEGMSPMRFTPANVPALLSESQTQKPQDFAMTRWSRGSISAPGAPTSPSSVLAAQPMTRARSSTTGPWAQSPLLLSTNLPSAEPSPTSLTCPEAQCESQSKEQIRTPNLDALLQSFTTKDVKLGRVEHAQASPRDMGFGLGLDFSGQTPPLYKTAGRHDSRVAAASPHLAIDMAPSQHSSDANMHSGSAIGLGIDFGMGKTGPSLVVANNCRSLRFPADIAESRIVGMEHIAQDSVTVHHVELQAQPSLMGGQVRSMHPSQSIASSISAFAYNPTPAEDPALSIKFQEAAQKASAKHASIWRRASKPRLGIRPDTSTSPHDLRGHVHSINMNLAEDPAPEASRLATISANSSRNTSNTSNASNATSTSFASDRKAQWVNKFWNALTPVTPTDVESQNSTPVLGEEVLRAADGSAMIAQRNVSRGSMRPLSLVAKRQSSGAGAIQYARNMRLPSPTPDADDEVAERDARQVAFRLLNGADAAPLTSADGERAQADMAAVKAIRRLSTLERKAKRSSGIGYITDQRSISFKQHNAFVNSNDSAELTHESEKVSTSLSRHSSLRTKRMSFTVFGGKERAISAGYANESDKVEQGSADLSQGANSSAAAFVYAKVQERTAMLDSLLSPRLADAVSPMEADGAPEVRRAAGHIPLLLSASASPLENAAGGARDEGLTITELHRAKREMRKLASHNQPVLSSDDEQQHRRASRLAEPLLQQPLASATGMPTSRLAYAHDRQQHWVEPKRSRTQSSGTLQHRRTRTARFAPDVETFPSMSSIEHHHYELEQEEHRAPVSIFTRSRSRNSSFGGSRRQQSMSGYEMQYAAHSNYAHFNGYDQYEYDAEPTQTWTVDYDHADGYQSRNRTAVEADTSFTYGQYGRDYAPSTTRGFAREAEGSTSKNLFWAGFVGMPWLWLIGGWYVASENGRLKNGSRFPLATVRETGVSRKVDMWTHEPSMLHQQRAAQDHFHVANSESHGFGGQQWNQSGTSTSGLGSTTELANGNTYAPSWTTATTGTLATLVTAKTSNTTSTDPNRTPARRSGKTKKLKTAKSLGNASLLFDLTPQVSFYQSPMRVLPHHHHHQQPDYTNTSQYQHEDVAPTASSSSSSLHDFGLPRKAAKPMGGPTAAQTMLAFRPASMSPATSSAVTRAMLSLEAWAQLERYVLLNRLAAMISGLLVLTGFSTAIYVVIANF